ncbi:zinc finger CCCH domain-containing protein [Striga asiatica]|uniref:Zinc finger CCCH domain-containing protein n=1 Tax=Striga asiatica TaxID=4170 RepID=A0A5A7RBA0_STRAF|nr:zinc finger CCCH domain-containing protein [Striga asiatica]
MGLPENEFYEESEGDSVYSDDSHEDPSFDVLDETRLSFSNLSLKKKTKTRIVKRTNDEEDERPDVIEAVIPELNEEDRKIYETIRKIIEGLVSFTKGTNFWICDCDFEQNFILRFDSCCFGITTDGGVERLKVEQCKIYLRKHGLRLSGNKETLILRIKEHIEIVDGGGEKKYPASSFVLNCKGDACTGDIVMFEQNVYEAFSIASRSANGPPCGTRIVAGRIVKESYGAAKQQHTFTIEVLWSKGEKPLNPLHPLLIKGRNLYRLKTMRRKWEDEGERQKMLSEKHARGGAARLDREARIQKKEMRKVHKLTRSTREEHLKAKQETAKTGPLLYSLPIKPDKSIKPNYTNAKPKYISNAPILPQYNIPQRQPLYGVNFVSPNFSNLYSKQDYIDTIVRNHQSHFSNLNNFVSSTKKRLPYKENQAHGPMRSSSHGLGHEQKQACRYYAQGRCHFGDKCRNLHGSASNTS